MIKYKKHTLANGLRVILAPMESTQAATVLVLVGAGSRYETREINGLSHFMEHMFFKGTKKRPSALEISKEINGVGGINNAFTSIEHAGYWVEVPAEHLETSIDIISDMLKNSLFAKEEIDRERGVILEELRMYLDTPMRFVDDVAQELLFGDTPLGWPTIGREAIIKKLERQDFIRYFEKQYRPQNMVVVVAGDIASSKTLALVEKYFGDIKKGNPESFLPAKIEQKKPAVKLHYKKTDQAHLILSVRTFPREDKRRWALSVLATILGGNMSSRLFIQVRERRGLAYYVHSDIWEMKDTGVLTAAAGLRLGSEKEAVQVILDEYNKLKTEKVAQDELRRAKQYLKGTMALKLESSMAVADFLGEQELLDRKIYNVEEIKANIDAVTADDLQKLAGEIFVDSGLNLAMVAPYKNENEFLKILQF
jgi:predicted Zn-dependent peptidase